MSLHIINQEFNGSLFPRLNRDFIGLAHDLEARRKDRRVAQQQQKAVLNRVMHLEKQQVKVQKDLMSKKRKLEQLISIKQRQDLENKQKQRLKYEREEELDRLKKQNQYMKRAHKHNLSHTIQLIREQNEHDGSRIRQERIDGEYRKKIQKQYDLKEKRDNWATLNISKERGKEKVNQFFKEKNKEHLEEYHTRMKFQQSRLESKKNSMKSLQERETVMRQKVQKSTAKSMKMSQIINHISRLVVPTEGITYEPTETRTMKPKQSKKTINTERRSQSIRLKSRPEEEVEENIQQFSEGTKKDPHKMIRKRRKNKHVNRYEQYQAF